MACLTHWNTIEIIDYGYAPDGTLYYVMEYVDGLNLGELIGRYGPLNPGRVIYLLRQVCAALAEAHAVGLIHRDIKPGNIMVTQLAGLADVVKVLDFGLVQQLGDSADEDRLTLPGMLVGRYMSPEQATGQADVRSDIYSLGAVGYFLLTGQTPFSGRWREQVLGSHVSEPTPVRELRPEIPADLATVIERCLRRDPGGRFANIQHVDEALATCACVSAWGSGEAVSWWRTSATVLSELPCTGETPPGARSRA
jgi:serine/threonine-protein kinase